MSTINTNGIDVNFPVPGKNNSSQGFRDNFSQIKVNLDKTSAELTDLQSKVIVKSPLTDFASVNDMGNTVISNAATSGFRSTTYNLGNDLSGTVIIDVNKADVHYGTLTGNLNLQFGGWAPSGTESNVVLRLEVPTASTVIQLPSACISTNNNYGVTLLENYANVSNTAVITTPSDFSTLEYKFSTLDCGNTITVSPVNRPYKATQITAITPPPTGVPGDMAGKITVGPSMPQLRITSTHADDYFVTTGSTTNLYTGLPVTFTGTSYEPNISVGTTYYVRNIVTPTTFTVSSSIGGANVNLSGGTGIMKANPSSYIYVSTGDFDSIVYNKTVVNTYSSGNIITLNNTTNLETNAPVLFSGNTDYANTKLVANTVYFIRTITGANVTISQHRFDGVAGAEVALGTSVSPNIDTVVYVGPDIWKRTSLTAF